MGTLGQYNTNIISSQNKIYIILFCLLIYLFFHISEKSLRLLDSVSLTPLLTYPVCLLIEVIFIIGTTQIILWLIQIFLLPIHHLPILIFHLLMYSSFAGNSKMLSVTSMAARMHPGVLLNAPQAVRDWSDTSSWSTCNHREISGVVTLGVWCTKCIWNYWCFEFLSVSFQVIAIFGGNE